MKIELECTSLAALAVALVERVQRHADYAHEMREDAGEAGDAARWNVLRRFLRKGGELELKAALEAALDCLTVEQETLPPCPRCGGQWDRGPSGEIYCTECR